MLHPVVITMVMKELLPLSTDAWTPLFMVNETSYNIFAQ
jgi:hypothetical protein